MRLWARLVLAVLGLVALGCLAGGCSSSSQSTSSSSPSTLSASPSMPEPTWSVVALGDSVPRGTNCGCTPYPQLTADDLAKSASRKVAATNDAVNGATTSSVLSQVDSDEKVIGHVRAATVVEIEIGANDVGQTQSCGTSVKCYDPRLESLQKNLAAVIARVHELTSGHKAAVVLLDYWSVWLGGKYAATQGPAYVSTAEQMTDEVDSIIKATASETGSDYVDLRAAFKGPSYSYDETHYLSSDGDHPNAAGHEQIAKAADGVLEARLG